MNRQSAAGPPRLVAAGASVTETFALDDTRVGKAAQVAVTVSTRVRFVRLVLPGAL